LEGEGMTIYQVVYYNPFGERVADLGYYEDKLDAEQRAFEVRMKTSPESGKVSIEDIFVHDSSEGKSDLERRSKAKKRREPYGVKPYK
jgi:hypothetical protein